MVVIDDEIEDGDGNGEDSGGCNGGDGNCSVDECRKATF